MQYAVTCPRCQSVTMGGSTACPACGLPFVSPSVVVNAPAPGVGTGIRIFFGFVIGSLILAMAGCLAIGGFGYYVKMQFDDARERVNQNRQP